MFSCTIVYQCKLQLKSIFLPAAPYGEAQEHVSVTAHNNVNIQRPRRDVTHQSHHGDVNVHRQRWHRRRRWRCRRIKRTSLVEQNRDVCRGCVITCVTLPQHRPADAVRNVTTGTCQENVVVKLPAQGRHVVGSDAQCVANVKHLRASQHVGCSLRCAAAVVRRARVR